jgi:transcriptional regulator with XRE-family HTH domain
VEDETEVSIRRDFGSRVREVRLQAGLSQEELAHRAALDRSYIGGVERGERNVSLVNIHKIAKALEVRPEVLFHGAS